MDSLDELYVTGPPIASLGFDRDYARQRRELPTYPFQRKRYWAKSAEQGAQAGVSTVRGGRLLHPLLGRRVAAAVADQVFESQLAANRPPILADHKIQGVVVMPGAAYIETAVAASAAAYGKPWDVCEVALVEPLLLDKRPKTVQTILTPEGDKAAGFRIVSLDGDGSDGEPSFTTHAVGRLEAPAAGTPQALDVAAQRARFTDPPFDDAWRAEALRKSGLEPGPSFCWAKLHWCHEQDALAELRESRDSDHAAGYHVHPGLLDSAFQLLGAALPGAGTGIDAYVPMTLQRLRLHDRPEKPGWFLASITSLQRDFATGNIVLTDPEGRVLMEVEGLRLRRVPRDWLARLVAEPVQDWTYELAWQKQPADVDATDVDGQRTLRG